MEATGSYATVIGATISWKKSKIIIDTVYEDYVSHLVVAQPLVMPYVRYMCMLLPLIVLNIRYTHLGLQTWATLKDIATCIWSFGCSFTCATTMRCAGFKLSFGIIIQFFY